MQISLQFHDFFVPKHFKDVLQKPKKDTFCPKNLERKIKEIQIFRKPPKMSQGLWNRLKIVPIYLKWAKTISMSSKNAKLLSNSAKFDSVT